MSWQGAPNAPNWQGSQAFEETPQTLYISPVPPTTTTNPSIGITDGNEVLLPNKYNTFYVDNLTVGEINGATGPVGAATWSTFPAISNVTATLDDDGDAQYNITGFENIYCGNLYAEGSGIFSGGAVNCQQVQSNYTTALVALTCGNNIIGGSQFVVNGGSTLDGGLFHGTTIGCLPFNEINTTRIDVLPVGIDMFSATYISMNAVGAADLVAGGAVALGAGDYISLQADSGTYIKSPSGDAFATLYSANNTANNTAVNIFQADYGVNISNGNTIQSNVFNVGDVISVPAFPTYPLWTFATDYALNDIVCYSSTNPTFGAGAVYQSLIAGSGVEPDLLYAPAWVSGTPYVISQLVQYNTAFTTMIYRCLHDVTSATNPEVDTANWFPTLRSSALPCWSVIQDDNLYNQIYFQPLPSGDTATYYWALCAPVGSGFDGLAIVKRNLSTNDLMAIGRLYDDTIYPPPFVPVASGNLNMEGYNIDDCGTLYVDNIYPVSPATYIGIHGDLVMSGTDVSILDLNYLRLLGQSGSPSTIRWTKADTTLGLSVGLTGDTIASYIEAEDVLSLSATSFASYGDWNFEDGALSGIASITSSGILYCYSTLNMDYGDITNLQVLACDNFQAYASSNMAFNSPCTISSITSANPTLGVHSVLDMTNHDIINCPNISGGTSADFINLQVDYINPYLNSVVQIQSTLDMYAGLIENVSQINVDVISDNVAGYVLVTAPAVELNSTTGNVVLNAYGDVDITSNYGNVNLVSTLGEITINSILDCDEINNNLTDYIYLNAPEIAIYSNAGATSIESSQDLDLTSDTGAINLVATLGYITQTAPEISIYANSGYISIESNYNLDLISDNGNVDISSSVGIVHLESSSDMQLISDSGNVDITATMSGCNLTAGGAITMTAPTINVVGTMDMNNGLIENADQINVDNIQNNMTSYVYISAPEIAIYGSSGVVSIEATSDFDITSDTGNVNIVAAAAACNVTADTAITLTAPTINVVGGMDLGSNALTGVSVFTMNAVQQPLIFFGSGVFTSGGSYSITFPNNYGSTSYSVMLTNTTSGSIVPFVGVKSYGSVIVWGSASEPFDWVTFGLP